MEGRQEYGMVVVHGERCRLYRLIPLALPNLGNESHTGNLEPQIDMKVELLCCILHAFSSCERTSFVSVHSLVAKICIPSQILSDYLHQAHE